MNFCVVDVLFVSITDEPRGVPIVRQLFGPDGDKLQIASKSMEINIPHFWLIVSAIEPRFVWNQRGSTDDSAGLSHAEEFPNILREDVFRSLRPSWTRRSSLLFFYCISQFITIFSLSSMGTHSLASGFRSSFRPSSLREDLFAYDPNKVRFTRYHTFFNFLCLFAVFCEQLSSLGRVYL